MQADNRDHGPVTSPNSAPVKPAPLRKPFVWVVASWACWGGFVGVALLFAGELDGPAQVLWFVAGAPLLGMATFPVRRCLAIHDESHAHMVAGAAVGGFFCAIAGGVLLSQGESPPGAAMGTWVLVGSSLWLIGVLSGALGGFVFSMTGLMAVHLGPLKTIQLIHEGASNDPLGSN